MRILIACEFSGTVRDAFRALGHDAVSCDLLPSRKPGPHHQGDVREILADGWDRMIAHPPCTYLTMAAEWAYGDGPYHQNVKPGTLVGAARRAARTEAIEFFHTLLDAPIPCIAVENPIGCIGTRLRKHTQIIQPYQFGEDASKATCLWLTNLPPLRPTRRVAGRMVAWRGKIVERWGNQTDSGQNKLTPSADRWATRSLTYPGIAAAMAAQWSAEETFTLT